MADKGVVMGSNEGLLFIFLFDGWMLFQWEGSMIWEGLFICFLSAPRMIFGRCLHLVFIDVYLYSGFALYSVTFMAAEILTWIFLTLNYFQKLYLVREINGETFKINGQNVIFLLPLDLKPPNLVGSWLVRVSCSHLPSHMPHWSCGHAMSCEKLKTLYLHFHYSYKHQTWRSVALGWGTPIY